MKQEKTICEYTSLTEIPALNYFWFLLYYRLYANTSLLRLGGYDDFIEEMIKLSKAKVRHTEIEKRCLNERSKIRNAHLGIDYAYCAFACCIDPEVKPHDIEEMTRTTASIKLSYAAMLTYIDHLHNRFLYESDEIETNSTMRSTAAIIKAHYGNATLENMDFKQQLLNKLLLSKKDFAVADLMSDENEITEFKSSFSRLRLSLGYEKEDDVRKISAYDFLMKIKVEKEKQAIYGNIR